MAEWAFVENNEIKELHDKLPVSWRNISGLDKASLQFLKQQGWLPVKKNHTEYDDTKYKLNGYIYEVFEDDVVETSQVVSLTQQELDGREQNIKTEFFNHLRQERIRRLQESDWTQANDVQQLMSLEWVESWKRYRQQLRDLPQLYENSANYDISSIEWPQVIVS